MNGAAATGRDPDLIDDAGQAYQALRGALFLLAVTFAAELGLPFTGDFPT